MAGTVYTKQLWVAPSIGPGLFPGPVVPPGVLWAVKSITISYGVNFLSGRAVVQGAGAAMCEAGAGFGVSYPGSFHLWGLWPLNPGDQLVADITTWTVDVWVGGYELTLP